MISETLHSEVGFKKQEEEINRSYFLNKCSRNVAEYNKKERKSETLDSRLRGNDIGQ